MKAYSIRNGKARVYEYPTNDYIVFDAIGCDNTEIEETIESVETIIINNDTDQVIFTTTDSKYHQYFIKHYTWDLEIFH